MFPSEVLIKYIVLSSKNNNTKSDLTIIKVKSSPLLSVETSECLELELLDEMVDIGPKQHKKPDIRKKSTVVLGT